MLLLRQMVTKQNTRLLQVKRAMNQLIQSIVGGAATTQSCNGNVHEVARADARPD